VGTAHSSVSAHRARRMRSIWAPFRTRPSLTLRVRACAGIACEWTFKVIHSCIAIFVTAPRSQLSAEEQAELEEEERLVRMWCGVADAGTARSCMCAHVHTRGS
jgi:hypothetical protein